MRSEIRDSGIDALFDKVRRRSYNRYLCRVAIKQVRGLQDAIVNFDFPVTAIVGPNGGGKTTVLGAAACAYRSVAPRLFFAKSGKYDQCMANWAIEYELVDKHIRTNDTLQRTASFKRERWRRDALDRETLVFGVARTVPASERVELQRCVSNNFEVPRDRIAVLPQTAVEAIRRVLGKDVSKFSEMAVDEKGRVSLLAGVTREGENYSEFHFGAGESSIIRMISKIESARDNCLILIEEIENGLHPVATCRMVEYLIDVAQRKRAQAIFTTHSDDALSVLPDEAIWAALDGYVEQGRLQIASMRAITGQIDARVAIFTEDDFAKEWITACLRDTPDVALDAVEIHALGGAGTAIKVHRNRQDDPTTSTTSICYLDGDADQTADPEKRIFKLPGATPELHVYGGVLDDIERLAAKLAVALHLRVEQQTVVVAVVRDVMNTNRDPHLLFSQVGERLGLISESVVRGAFLSLWTQTYPNQVSDIVDPMRDLLPMSKSR